MGKQAQRQAAGKAAQQPVDQAQRSAAGIGKQVKPVTSGTLQPSPSGTPHKARRGTGWSAPALHCIAQQCPAPMDSPNLLHCTLCIRAQLGDPVLVQLVELLRALPVDRHHAAAVSRLPEFGLHQRLPLWQLRHDEMRPFLRAALPTQEGREHATAVQAEACHRPCGSCGGGRAAAVVREGAGDAGKCAMPRTAYRLVTKAAHTRKRGVTQEPTGPNAIRAGRAPVPASSCFTHTCELGTAQNQPLSLWGERRASGSREFALKLRGNSELDLAAINRRHWWGRRQPPPRLLGSAHAVSAALHCPPLALHARLL